MTPWRNWLAHSKFKLLFWIINLFFVFLSTNFKIKLIMSNRENYKRILVSGRKDECECCGLKE